MSIHRVACASLAAALVLACLSVSLPTLRQVTSDPNTQAQDPFPGLRDQDYPSQRTSQYHGLPSSQSLGFGGTRQLQAGSQSDTLAHGLHGNLRVLSWKDILLAVLASGIILVAAGAGIGGGGALLPLYMVLAGFSTRESVALSNITIMAGSLANFILNVTKRHPVADRPLIDWDLVLVMEPTTLVGAVFGGYLNAWLPTWITTSLLSLLLTGISCKLIQKAVELHRLESHALLAAQRAHSVAAAGAAPLLDPAHADVPYLEAADEADAKSPSSEQPGSCVLKVRPLSNSPDSSKHTEQLSKESAHSGSGNQLAAATAAASSETVGTHVDVASVAMSTTAATDQHHHEAAECSSLSAQLPWMSPFVLLAHTSHSNEPTHISTLPADGAALPSYQEGSVLKQPSMSHVAPRADEHVLLLSDYDTLGDTPNSKTADGDYHVMCEVHQKNLKTERQLVPWRKFSALVLLSASLAASDVLKFELECNSAVYWLVVLTIIPLALLILLVMRQALIKKSVVNRELGVPQHAGDIKWDARTTIIYPAVCTIAGVAAGLFGVGGGIVKGPLMLELGVVPEVAAATSATMILFTSSAASIVYINFGYVILDYGIALFILGFVITLAGQLGVHRLMLIWKRTSIIVIAMAASLVLSVSIMYYQAAIRILEVVKHPEHLAAFGNICAAHAN